MGDELLRKASGGLKRAHDPVHGGFGHAPKFPHALDLRVLLRCWKRFADEEDDIDYRLDAFWGVIGRRIANANCFAGDSGAITVDHVTGNARVVCSEGHAEALRRSEIEQGHAPTCGLIQVVREVGICLHNAELEQFAK